MDSNTKIRLGVILAMPRAEKRSVQKRIDAYNECANESVEILLLTTEDGPGSTDSRYEELLAGPHIIYTARKLASMGVCAMIVSCFSDPAVGALRELFDFPIIGPGEASFLTATLLGDRFSVVTILENGKSMIQEEVRKLGLSERLASVRAINMTPIEIESDQLHAEAAVRKEAEAAVRDDGASVLVVGCMSPDMVSIGDELSVSLGIPVVNPIRTAVNLAESLAKQKQRTSRVTYPTPISLTSRRLV
jgi:allantoin racemase